MARHARHAAAQAGNPAAEAAALIMLGATEAARGRLREATSHLEQALALYREEADWAGGLAGACRATGDSGQAHSHWQQALARCTDLGTPEAGLVSR